MPFGDYKDFDECVSKNSGKDDAKAYCAAIKRAIEGDGEGEHGEFDDSNPLILPFSLVEEVCPPCAARMQQMKMTSLKVTSKHDFAKVVDAIRTRFSFQSVATRPVYDVEIFASGVHTDSAGQVRKWSSSDLDSLALSSSVPLKVGHTSDDFNNKLADQLGLPIALLTGENGKGSARLGSVINLRHDGKGKLVADFDAVPEPLADLIEGGQFNAVSAEIGLDDDVPVLTAVALLGSESPAIKNLKPLNMSQFSERGDMKGGWVRFEFDALAQQQTGQDELEKGKGVLSGLISYLRTAKNKERQAKGQAKLSQGAGADKMVTTNKPAVKPGAGTNINGSESDATLEQEFDFNLAAEELPQLYAALGLPDTASLQEVLAAIEALKGAGAGMEGMIPGMEGGAGAGGGAAMGMMSEFASNPVIIEMQKKIASQSTYISGLEHKDRVNSYFALTRTWTAVPGKPLDLAEELAKVHESVGEDKAKQLILQYQRIQKASESVGLISNLGTSRSPDPDDSKDEFQESIEKWATENKQPFEKALAHFAVNSPREFGEYRRRVKQSMQPS